MRLAALIGALLIALGVIGLTVGGLRWTDAKPVIKAGPLQVNKQEEHYVSIPIAGSIVLIVVGAGLVAVGRKPSA
jgi:hypothetical protein